MAFRECLDFESTAIESADAVDKGTVEYGIKARVQTLQIWGRKRAVMFFNQEKAIVALAMATASERDEETPMQVGPRADFKSKDPIEGAGGRGQLLIRTPDLPIDAHYKVELNRSDPNYTWLARRAGWTTARFTVGEGGLAPRRRLAG